VLSDELLSIPVEKLIEKCQDNNEMLIDFMFCVLGTFRYSSGLNFRASTRFEDIKLKYLQTIFFKLDSIIKQVNPETYIEAKVYSKRDYVEVDTIEALNELQDEKKVTKGRKPFDDFLFRFLQTTPNNEFFNEDYIKFILEAPAITSLVRTKNTTRTDLLIDKLYLELKEGNGDKVIGRHCCCRKNTITLIPRYIISHLILSIIKHVPKVKKYLTCTEYNIETIIFSKGKLLAKPRRILYGFFEKIAILDIKSKFIFVVENADLLDEPFHTALRYCKNLIPPYIKIILTADATEKLKIINSHNLMVEHGNYLKKLCSYFIEKSVKSKELVNEAMKHCESIEVFKTLWKQLNKTEATIENFKNCISNFAPSIINNRKENRIRMAEKRIKEHKNNDIIEKIIILLKLTNSPLPFSILEDCLTPVSSQVIREVFIDFPSIFYLSEAILSLNTAVILKHKRSWELYWEPSIKDFHGAEIVKKCLSLIENEASVEIPEYYRLNAVNNYVTISKNSPAVLSTVKFLYLDWIYSQIIYFKSFDFVYSEISTLQSIYTDNDLTILKNQLYLLEQTYEGAEIPLPDFAAHMKSRLMTEKSLFFKSFMSRFNRINCSYFKPMFCSIKENNNFEFISTSDSEIVAVVMKKKLIAWATAIGMIYVYSMPSYVLVSKVYMENEVSVICFTVNSKLLIASDNSLYLWSPEESKMESKLTLNEVGIGFLSVFGSFFYAAGKDNILYKGTISPLSIQKKTNDLEKTITALLVIANPHGEDTQSTLVFTGHHTGTINVFDAELMWITKIRYGDDTVVSLQNYPLKEYIISIQSEGGIKIIDTNYYDIVNDLSIFDVNQEKLLAGFFLESRENLVVAESQALKFYKLSSYSLLETWYHPFKARITCAYKANNNKYLLIGDKEGHIIVYNIHKQLEQRVSLRMASHRAESPRMPSHRAESPIKFLLYTTSLPDEQHLLTCSTEREVKIWGRNTCRFLKKYNLDSITSTFLY